MKSIFWPLASVAGFIATALIFVMIATSYNQLLAEVEKANLTIARAQDSKNALNDTITSFEDMMVSFSDAYIMLCPQDRNGLSTERLNACSLLSQATLSNYMATEYLDLLSKYNRATLARVTAQSQNDFETATENYRKLLVLVDKLENVESRNQWKSFIYEGMAYSQWRRATYSDDIDTVYLSAAKSDAMMAQSFDPHQRSATVALTYMKILCSEPNPDSIKISTYYRGIKESLQRQHEQSKDRLVNGSRSKESRNIEISLHQFYEDNEIFIVCKKYLAKDITRLSP